MAKVRCGSNIYSLQKHPNYGKESKRRQERLSDKCLKYALQFADSQIEDLVASFNCEVHNNGWVGMRALHDRALIDEFIRRGIDISCVHDGHSTSFSHHVRYNIDEHKLETID